uniref:Uncharacterized protein n=1 Tax=Alexandrium monilatum TaxID=311494 RepID=A0A7S4QJE2_9DINO
MKSAAVLAAVAALSGHHPLLAGAARVARVAGTPVTRVLALIRDLEARVQSDGLVEQRSYDKYQCWCEDTLGRKVNDISFNRQQIEGSQTRIEELKAQIASHGAEIEHVKADIKANVESQRDATEVRNKERAGYTDEKTESEQSTGALEAAIKVLTGAGAGKKNFLETLQQAQLLSVAAGIRGVLAHSRVSARTSDQDLQIVHRFAERPEDFVAGHRGAISATQIVQNPFGDYAPQSTQIQGILKGMYGTVVAAMEKANAEEAEAQKAFQELMATKRSELQTLQLTLDKQNLDKADKTKSLADQQQLKDDAEAQLAADEEFFVDTKAACKLKATEWSERSRLRTEELTGIRQAVAILSSPEAQQIFANATAPPASFVEVSSSGRSRASAYERLLALARRHPDLGLEQLAARVRSGGHFDEVIASIDRMIGLLRKEEQADIEHRDRCQGSLNKNQNDMEDLNSTIDKSGKALARMGDGKRELMRAISELEVAISSTQGEMAQALELRNGDHAAFQQALKDDADAIELLSRAILALTKFYKTNRIPLGLLAKQQPGYSQDEDEAPETMWKGASYGGRKSEATGILSILGMIKEDLEKEVKTSRADEASARAAYGKFAADMRKVLGADMAAKAATEQQLAELEAKMVDTEEFKGQKSEDLSAEVELSTSLYKDCSWIKTHFDSRRQKRKAELDGLVEAKAYLAGVESGNELAP